MRSGSGPPPHSILFQASCQISRTAKTAARGLAIERLSREAAGQHPRPLPVLDTDTAFGQIWTLSTLAFELAKKADEADVFAGELDKTLADFDFPDDFVLDVFEKVNA